MRAKTSSIAVRAFRTVLISLLSSLFVILLFAWWALEELEDAMYKSDHNIELEHFEHYGQKDRYHKVQTGQMVSVFRPRQDENNTELPIVFQGLPIPYDGIVEVLNTEYAVLTHAFPEGDYYLAKNMLLFEAREERLILYIQLLAIGIFIVGAVVARLTSRILSRPVVQLAAAIRALPESGGAGRLDEEFTDLELKEIATAINTNLDRVDESFERERALISMASHELRTPVAVVLGATAIIEKRGKLETDDARTLQRITRAAGDMSDNIRALLDLARKTRQSVDNETILIGELLSSIRMDYELDADLDLDRLILSIDDHNTQIVANRALVKMVLHNIISNALSHTDGQVRVMVFQDRVEICDEGTTTPAHNGADPERPAANPQSTGLGLYIVKLACERLGWVFAMDAQAGGSRIRLWFDRNGAGTAAG